MKSVLLQRAMGQFRWFPYVAISLLVNSCIFFTSPKSDFTAKLSYNAEQLYFQSTSHGLELAGESIQNLPHDLIEDDAPGFGYSAQGGGSAETISGAVRIKKILILDKAPLDTAYIVGMFYPSNPPEPNNGRHLRFNVNGHIIDYVLEHFWTKVPVDPGFLTPGENSITVQALEPDAAFVTYLAVDGNFALGSKTRQSHPNHSGKSLDGGKSWDMDHLGSQGDLDGEYPIRLLLQSPHSDGVLKTKIIDRTPSAFDQEILHQPVTIIYSQVMINGEDIDSWSGSILFRTGSCLYPDSSWSDWSKGIQLDSPLSKQRFVQFKLIFPKEGNARLTSLDLVSSYKLGPQTWERTWVIKEFTKYPRIRSSFSFPMEDPQHPVLQELRQKYELDEVVKGAISQLDTLKALSSWVAAQWDWYLLPPEREINSWNTLEILDRGEDGQQCGGYCLHYAVSFMQAAQSFGFPARVVNANYSVWSGHEMTEVWVPELGKWILMDANFDLIFTNAESGEPLNSLDLHERFLDQYYPGESIDRDAWSRASFVDRTSKVGKPTNVIGIVGGGARHGTLSEYEWWNPPLELAPYCGGFGYLNLGYFRLLPRSNYLSEPTPLPVNHGRTHWGWDGYLCWTDAQTPRSQEHKIFTSRPADFYWNLNEVDFSATRVGERVLKLNFDGNLLPGSHFAVSYNGTNYPLTNSETILTLESGLNEIKMFLRDAQGKSGRVSKLVIEIN